MKLTVLGSTGHTGRYVLAEGLRRGHQITAFTRRPDALKDRTTLAAVVQGDGRNQAAVRNAVKGADSVIAIIAASSRNGPHQTAEVARTLTRTMVEEGVRRLVITSAYPIVGTRPRAPIAILRLVFAAAYADARAMEQIVSTSDLDWTIARLNQLSDGPAHGKVRISRELFERPSGMTRADAAIALLDIVEDLTLAKTAVNLAGA